MTISQLIDDLQKLPPSAEIEVMVGMCEVVPISCIGGDEDEGFYIEAST